MQSACLDGPVTSITLPIPVDVVEGHRATQGPISEGLRRDETVYISDAVSASRTLKKRGISGKGLEAMREAAA